VAAIILILVEGGLGADVVNVIWGGHSDLAQITEGNPNQISTMPQKSAKAAK
jgi:hypothetical protein